jgi:Domain of unknown function (DUF1707)
MSDAGALRASDAERDRAAEALREHFAAGRISGEELDERLSAVYRARTVAELGHLRRDLPELPPSPAARRADLVRRQAELRRQLLQHAGGALSPFAICTLIWVGSGASGAFWPAFLLIFPLMFLARNGWRLYGPAPELERVQRELEHHGRHRHRGRHRSRRRDLPPPSAHPPGGLE